MIRIKGAKTSFHDILLLISLFLHKILKDRHIKCIIIVRRFLKLFDALECILVGPEQCYHTGGLYLQRNTCYLLC